MTNLVADNKYNQKKGVITMKTKPEKEYFYCYPPAMFAYLHGIKKLAYICKGINEKSQNTFFLFKQSDELTDAIQEYKHNCSDLRSKDETKL